MRAPSRLANSARSVQHGAMGDAIPGFYAAAATQPRWPRLTGAVSADLCIVGGGLTGVSVAREFAERGRAAVLVEARRIGWGASGRNGGQTVIGFAAPMERVERLLGRAAARALWAAMCEERKRLDAETAGREARRGFVLAARRRRTLPALARWAETAARDYDYAELRPLDRDALAAHVASPAYCGGLYDGGARHFDPLALCRARGRRAAAAGAALFEDSPAVAIEAGRRGAAVRTRDGCVHARAVVLACNAYIGGLDPALASRLASATSYVCVTEPLGAALAAALMPSGAALCDDRRAVDYIRRTPDHRLLFGGGSRFVGREPRDIAKVLRPRIAAVFPRLAGVAIDHAWSGKVAVTRNRLPGIGRDPRGRYYAHGYSGEGLILSGMAGRAIAAALDGDSALFDLLRRIPQRPLPRPRALWLTLAQCAVRLADAL